ncbi:MAG TPA: hypothetical protein VEQ58_01235, partial [Polyangiaceae bacterium]|nr:hypothetical protein [Polyangiaceae bacterium]
MQGFGTDRLRQHPRSAQREVGGGRLGSRKIADDDQRDRLEQGIFGERLDQLAGASAVGVDHRQIGHRNAGLLAGLRQILAAF